MPTFQNLAPGAQFNFPDPFGMPALANAMRFKNAFSAMAPAGSFAQPAQPAGQSQAEGAPGMGPAKPEPKQETGSDPTPAPGGGVEAPAPTMIADPYKPPVQAAQPAQTVRKRSAGGLDYVASYSPGAT